MINNITGSVVFPSNGQTLKADFSPQPGLTAVIGPNESGKTFSTIELTRYLLYGKAALRGPAPDYKTLVAQGNFTIRGARYTIKRSLKKEELLDSADNVLAVGAEAVTAKVIELMGYGLKVFDIVNASVQTDAIAFGKMLPSERKRMIDEVVGVLDVEQLELACRREATAFKREAEALTRSLHAPVKPKKPKGYKKSEILSEERHKLLTIRRAADAIANQIRPAHEPEQPRGERPTKEQIEGLVRHQADRERELKRLSELTGIMQRAFPIPRYTIEQIDAAEEKNAALAVQCPKCKHKFSPHGYTFSEDAPDLTIVGIQRERLGHKMMREHDEAAREIPTINPRKDFSMILDKAQQDLAAWEAYDRGMQHVAAQLALNEKAFNDLRVFGDLPTDEQIEALAQAIIEARVYEGNDASYTEFKAVYLRTQADIVEKNRLADAFKIGSDELGDARKTLKAYLAPAISRVASSLMADMTHQAHSNVYVSEDMEILIDGQSISTLSGGAATVANIALRLALGQVLVKQTFPVFLGDEMDGDQDAPRREATLAAMVALKNRLSQLILITHRSVEVADHVIDLGDTTYK